ncbi:MAG: hypothetical protein GXP54_02490 [Deltaproteobacteria bacterium]|nr:hypothetical protein [Deltaproteobacteria bacterium]
MSRFSGMAITLCLAAAMSLPAGCGSSGSGGQDADAGLTDLQADAQQDIASQEVSSDAVDEVSQDVHPATESRRFSFRVLAGVSMGANSVTIAAHHPEDFDVVGSMGGYVDNRYLAHVMDHYFLGGFCSMDQILANLDNVNDPDDPDVFCGPVKPDMPYEHEWSFNHLYYDNSGGDWGREFLFEVMEGFMFAFGNMIYYNPDNPVLPPGVSMDWWNNEKDKCNNPAVVGKPYNYNAEYNPKGEYNLITFCDGDTYECDESSLACLAAKGVYEPDKPHKMPIRFLLAVDYNGNLKRDYGEPVIHNAMERFKDTGIDGCFDKDEDGKGGCTGGAAAGTDDPNGDDYDLFNNIGGTEKNWEYDEGEPFDDFGLDGVPAAEAGFKDYGEGDGQFTRNPRLEAQFQQDARTFFMDAPLDEIRRIEWYFDGGIRDAIHAVPSTMHQSNALKLRGLEVREYDDFTATDNSLLPGVACEEVVNHLKDIDFSATGMGRNIMMRYGNPNASDNDILAGDGKHIGLICNMVNRLLVFFTMSAFRLPDPIIDAGDEMDGVTLNTSVWSPSVQNRIRYSVSLPPGYNAEKNKDLRYPLMIFLPGHGMDADVMVQAGTLFNLLMVQGVVPRFIMLAPDGQCCHVNTKTGMRYCGCKRGGDDCLDPNCKGDHDTCAIVDTGDTVQECNGGHFFVNQKTNYWADPEAYKVMRFEDGLFDVIADVDKRFRTRKPAQLEVPYDF